MAQRSDPRALLAQADKSASSASSGWKLFSKEGDWEKAAEKYKDAATAFRDAELFKDAGAAYEKAAQIERQHLNDDEEAANSYKAAFLGYRKSSLDDATRVLKLELEHWRRQKREHKIRQISKDLAELYDAAMKAEQDGERQKLLRREAIEAYETAGKEFDYTNQANSARPLFLKAAELAALNEDYQRAIQHFEGAARQCVDNNLLRFSVKDYLLKAGLCHLASRDSISTKRALEGYCELDRGFAEQREHQLLVDLLQAVESADKTMFSDKLYEYDRVSRLDNWKTSLCLKIMESIEEGEEDFS